MRRLVAAAVLLAALAVALLPAGATAALKAMKLRPGLEVQALAAGSGGKLWAAGLERVPGQAPKIFTTWFAPNGEQRLRHKAVPGGESGIGDLIRGPEGDMWFTIPGADTVAHTPAAGGWLGLSMPTGSAPTGLVSAGGDVWVTLADAPAIVQVEPTPPATTTFPLRAGTSLTRVVLGSDGHLWAIASGSGQLVRVSMKGGAAYVPLESGGAHFTGTVNSDIAAGPEGLIWVSQSDRAAIGQVHQAPPVEGHESAYYRRFVVPGGPTTLLSPGPAGDVWFANVHGGIGSIGVDGEVGEVHCVDPCGQKILALARGPEGRLWLATRNSIVPYEPPPLKLRIENVRGRVGVDRKGADSLFMRLRCSGGAVGQACHGRIELRQGGRLLQSSPRRISTPGRREEWAPMNHRVSELLAAHGRLPVLLLATTEGKITTRRPITLTTER